MSAEGPARVEGTSDEPACGRVPCADTASACGGSSGEGVPVADMHCHLDFAPGSVSAARRGGELGVAFLSATVTPATYGRASAAFAGEPDVRVGAGLHPWWLADGRCGEDDVALLEGLVPTVRVVGEVGLDFSPACLGERDPEGVRTLQVRAFERVCTRCAQVGGRVLTIHAVRSATDVLDVLARTGAAESCACILHWFSGTSDELTRARRMGCYFSVNPRMLASKRGRAYARAMDARRILLETDLPAREGEGLDAQAHAGLLRRTLAQLEELRGERLSERMWQTSAGLLGLAGYDATALIGGSRRP